MATQQPEGVSSRPAAADLRNTLYQLNVINADQTLALCGAGARPDGIQDGPAELGEQCRYFTLPGKAGLKVKAGGTFAAGAELTSDATGRAVVAASGNHVFGKASEAGVVGRIVGFTPAGYTKP